MFRSVGTLLFLAVLPCVASVGSAMAQSRGEEAICHSVDYHEIGRNPTRAELRCRHRVTGPGRFGLLSYLDVPVYQSATPMPGTHLMGVPGHARPQPYETFEEWEWRVLGTPFGPEVTHVRRDLESLDPEVAERVVRLEARLAREGIRAVRRETWRPARRQAYLFQQGRSRPGHLATTTLTSWHSQMDDQGFPAGRAVDYDVPRTAMQRFHEIVAEAGLLSYGPDSHDPGHVYLPKLDGIPAAELMLLRTIPRVPEITLATGLPVDRSLPIGGREAMRETATAFARYAFRPYPPPTVATPPRPWAFIAPIVPVNGLGLASTNTRAPAQTGSTKMGAEEPSGRTPGAHEAASAP
jgi:hypothetical protein